MQEDDSREMDTLWGEDVIALRAENAERGQLFNDGNYAMFIHWGPYAQLANKVDGETHYGIGAWIMNPRMANIPVEEYMEMAKTFNPVNFDATEIAQFHKCKGMPPCVGISLTHTNLRIFKEISQWTTDTDFGLILEDDALLNMDFDKLVEHLSNLWQKRFEQSENLFVSLFKRDKFKDETETHISTQVYGTPFYQHVFKTSVANIYNRNAAKKFYESILNDIVPWCTKRNHLHIDLLVGKNKHLIKDAYTTAVGDDRFVKLSTLRKQSEYLKAGGELTIQNEWRSNRSNRTS